MIKDRLKNLFWYLIRYRYLKRREKHAKRALSYFRFIRETNPMRQRIGEEDMFMGSLPMFNPKKEQNILSSSGPFYREMLSILPKEFEKLKRWKRMKNVSYRSRGKVVFGSGKEFKLSI